MRLITVKYEGSCNACHTSLVVGQSAMHERRAGLWCVGCAPTDTEAIRAIRQEVGDRRADKYDAWAAKRETRAEAVLNSNPSVRHDWAFITQPGHIPFRARMNAADDRACESLKVAEGFRGKANRLRHVVVKGDAERRRERQAAALDVIVTKGTRVHDFAFGDGVVIQVCKKSYRVKFDGSGDTYARDKTYLKPLVTITPEQKEAMQKAIEAKRAEQVGGFMAQEEHKKTGAVCPFRFAFMPPCCLPAGHDGDHQDVAGGHYGNPPSTSLAAVEALTKEVQLKASHATD